MEVNEAIQLLMAEQDCSFSAARRLPQVLDGHRLPDDLVAFYLCCGGAVLFGHTLSAIQINSPEDMVLATPAIRGTDSVSDHDGSWYILGSGISRDIYFIIDLGSDSNGKCYVANFYNYGDLQAMVEVADSFTGLLMKSLQNKATHGFWWDPSAFDPMDDADSV